MLFLRIVVVIAAITVVVEAIDKLTGTRPHAALADVVVAAASVVVDLIVKVTAFNCC